MMLPDTSFLLNVIIFLSVLLSMIRAYCCCCCSAPESWVFFLAKVHVFYTSRYLVLILLSTSIVGWYSTQPINTRTKKCRKYNHACYLRFFFLSHPRVFSAHDFVRLPPVRNSHPGSHGTYSSPFPTTYRACLRFSREKEKRFRIRFPSLASPCVELVCIHATYQAAFYAARRLRGAFCGQFAYWCFCFRLWSRPERTHTSFFIIHLCIK